MSSHSENNGVDKALPNGVDNLFGVSILNLLVGFLYRFVAIPQ